MFSKLCLLLVASVGASCTHNIHVVDEAGNPVAGAKVYPVTRSFRYEPSITNEKGTAYIRQDVPTVENIQVTKPGYRSPPTTNFDLPKPITVVLRK